MYASLYCIIFVYIMHICILYTYTFEISGSSLRSNNLQKITNRLIVLVFNCVSVCQQSSEFYCNGDLRGSLRIRHVAPELYSYNVTTF